MKRTLSRRTTLAAVIALGVWSSSGAGIPEPGLVMYGKIRNDLGGAHARIEAGSLSWTIMPSGGAPVTVTAQVTNLLDQFSYMIEVPYETVMAGLTLSPNKLQLMTQPLSYNRSQVFVDGAIATFRAPAGTNFVFSQGQRGLVERVDLDVTIAYPDADGDGLPDYWENAHFPGTGTTPGADSDGDGVSNEREYKAGTNPNDEQSAFEIDVAQRSTNVFVITWAGASNRTYKLSRSASLMSGFTPLATGIPATPPLNSYTDTTAVGMSTVFYQINLE